MEYRDALAWLYERQALGMKLGLRNEEELLTRLGEPHRTWRALHVAGTNGKGSTSVMLASMLRAGGVRAGLYVSPHLVDFGERIQVDLEPIAPERVATLVERTRPHVDAMASPPTFFEVVTALAFRHFADERVRAAVVEVGLGGRLDSTNLVSPDVTVITNVGLDHTDVLGPTIRDVAREKAGILKAGVPVVTAASGDALDVIEARARELGCPVDVLGRDLRVHRLESSDRGQRIRIQTPRSDVTVGLGLLGRSQAENAALAWAAMEQWNQRRPRERVDEEAMKRGLAAAQHPGRLELFPGPPRVLLDGAHNREALERLLEFLPELPARRVVAVVGILRDKPWREMTRRLAGAVDVMVCTKSRNARATDPVQLAAAASGGGCVERVAERVEGAVDAALREANDGDLVLVTGSLFTVGEARAHLMSLRPSTEGLHVRQ